jgi:hypothetical protein
MTKQEKFSMSADQALDIKTVVYVRLLDEGTEVWRPARATPLADGTFEIAEPDDYDPETETWEFPPHTRVKCVSKKFADGDKALVAVAVARQEARLKPA